MSDAGIDQEYEEQLQAAARYLDVIVTYRESGEERTVRTFMDTPEGRGTAAKVADSYFELPAVKEVRVVPVGAGPVSSSTVAGSAGGSTSVAAPAPTRATRCCQPQMLRKASGPRLCHSLYCSDKSKRGEPIDVKTYAKHAEWGTT